MRPPPQIPNPPRQGDCRGRDTGRRHGADSEALGNNSHRNGGHEVEGAGHGDDRGNDGQRDRESGHDGTRCQLEWSKVAGFADLRTVAHYVQCASGDITPARLMVSASP